MSNQNTNHDLPTEISDGLAEVSRRDLKLRWLTGLTKGMTLMLAIMILAMALDWFFGWLSPAARWLVTLSTLGVAIGGFGLWLALPLIRRPDEVGIAKQVDQHLPNLEERWSTVTELARNQDPAAIRGSQDLLDAVKSEASQLKFHVNPDKIVSDAPLRLYSKWLGGIAVLFLLFFAVNFPQAKTLLARLLLPGADISLTQIELQTRSQTVPLKESLNLAATVSGRVHEDATFITLRDPQGSEIVHPMIPDETNQQHFGFNVASVKDSFDFRVQSGDKRTEWQQVTAISRPKITDISLQITPPAYSQLPSQQLSSLPHRVRLLENSQVDLRFKADQDLSEFRLDFENEETQSLEQTSDGWYRFTTQPQESVVFKAVLRNPFDLENKIKPSSRFIVYQDLPPSVRVLDPSTDVAKRSTDTVAIDFEASDDFGIDSAELVVSHIDQDGNRTESRLPIDLEEQSGEKSIRQTFDLDLSQFNLEQGDELSYIVAVTDTHEAKASSMSESSNSKSSDPMEAPPSESDLMADNQASDQNETDPNDQNASPNDPSKPGNTSPMIAATKDASKPSEESQPGSAPPPNDMAKRVLDAGQTAACQPRNITIDEWAGEFEGESTEKLQLAIDPVLQRLKGLLAGAEEKVHTTQTTFADEASFGETEQQTSAEADDLLRQSQLAIEELTAKSTDTPYAFIGLQLQNIGTSLIDPAREALRSIDSHEPDEIAPLLKSARFHIQRALAMLDDLEKSYEAVKREEKIADAMQRLAKMHQLFLENSQKLLGSKKPGINSYDRKIAEVDDAFAEELKALLEEKKKIMDELAKLLAEDPRMLRRYLAMLQLQGTTQRDQMTLLAERQKELKSQVLLWSESSPEQQPELAQSLRLQYSAKLSQAIEDTTTLHDNMETWLPLEVDPKNPAVTEITNEAQSLVETMIQCAQKTEGVASEQALDAAHVALGKLRSLHEQLPLLSEEIPDEPKIDIYIANRLEEVERLISYHSGWIEIMTALADDNFARAAEVVQHTLAQDTATLSDKIVTTKDQVSSMSPEIKETAEELVRIVQADILYPQSVATENLAEEQWDEATEMEQHLVTAFSLAENSFDRLMNLIIAKLDEAPAPSAPGANKSLDDILAMLENEIKAAESLGIPCRPINVSLMTDWMTPQQGSGSGSPMAQAQGKAAQAQAAQAQKEADRLQRDANAKAAALQAKYEEGQGQPGQTPANGPQAPRKSWNVLVSQLEKDILQGRDNVPPEKYRDAINAYFQSIAENIPTTTH